MAEEAVIVSAVRTPIGKFLGTLSGFSATELGAIAIREAVQRAGIAAGTVDEVIMGNVVSAGLGQAPARQAAIHAGIPAEVSAMTINKVCGSGLQAVMLAAQAIRAGDGHAYVAGGMESMSNAPYLLPKARTGYRFGDGQLVDGVKFDGLWCSFEHCAMGDEAEYVAAEYHVSRAAQDRFAYESHMKAQAATEAGRFRDEMIPISIPGKKSATIFDRDESIRPDTTEEALAALKPAFSWGATVTAGNAPGLNDGAAATVVMSASAARAQSRPALGAVLGYATAALEPKLFPIAPTHAIGKLLQRTALTIHDFDLIEVNEAFAVQVLADGQELGWDWARVNVNGGAVALGHPIGASGARVLTTLLYALQRRGGGRGLAALCLGGGGAVALAVQVG